MKKIAALLFLVILTSTFAFTQDSQHSKNKENQSVPSSGNDKNVSSINGTVRLRVTFGANGEVKNIVPLSNLPCGLTEQVVEAAKQTLVVSQKNGELPIAASKEIEISNSLKNINCVPTKNAINEKAEAIVKRAIEKLGGERYLQIKSVIGRGFFTLFREGEASLPSEFVDYIVYPEKERTEFKTGGARTVQVNFGNKGWIFDGAAKTINDQTPEQVENFRQAIRTSLDNFLRGNWRSEKDARLEYVGRREAGLGKRNEVVRLIYADGTKVEFEFSATDGLPAKLTYKRQNADGEETTEEDRFAQFVEVQGIFVPFIIDHYRNGKQTSRINYQTVELNVPVAESLFVKPANAKEMKKN